MTAEQLWEIFPVVGNLVNFRFFWEDQFVTVEPEHVKVSQRSNPNPTPFSNFTHFTPLSSSNDPPYDVFMLDAH